MRLSPDTGKEDCRVIDFVDSGSRVAGVISTPTLFGLDPSELIDGKSSCKSKIVMTDNIHADETTDSLETRAKHIDNIDETPVRSRVPRGHIPDPKSVTYVDYDNPFAFADEASGAPHIKQISQFAWVGCGEDVYVLDCLKKGYVRIERMSSACLRISLFLFELRFSVDDDEDGPHFRAHHTPSIMSMSSAMALKLAPYMRNKEILVAQTLLDAVRGSETYVKNMMEGSPAG